MSIQRLTTSPVLERYVYRILFTEQTEPLDQRNATRISSLSEDSNDILDAMKMLNLTNAAKHETWSAHLLISENQSAVLDQIEQVEEFSEIVLNQSFERCETAKDSSVEIRQRKSFQEF